MESDSSSRKGNSRSASKVLDDEQAKVAFSRFRREKKVVVHCHGVFDLLHRGHVEHLEEAKAKGEILIVSVTSDEHVNKGPGRPVFPVEVRALMVAALEVVDYVWISRHPTAEPAIEIVRPAYFVKGPDYVDLSADVTGNIQKELDAVKKNGGVVVFTEAPAMSSSTLINATGLAHSEQLTQWLGKARGLVSEKDIDGWFSEMQSLKVLVIGETIVDRYVFCEALGKTSKDPVLAFLKGGQEDQLGGAVAVARHGAGLGASVTLLTRLGMDEAGKQTKELMTNAVGVSSVFQQSAEIQTIVKTRFVDEGSGAKVFETYEMSDGPATKKLDDEFCELLDGILDDFDLILVADYGHGLLSEQVVQRLAGAKGTVAVNTQSNAGNRGFNSISRYPRVDIVSLNGSEVQLELKKKHTTVSELMPGLGHDLGAQWVVVTEGAGGLALWGPEKGVTQMPAFTEQVRDRVGAGDALFVVVAVLLQVGASTEGVGLFGNLAGASMISDLGNRSTANAPALIRHAKIALK